MSPTITITHSIRRQSIDRIFTDTFSHEMPCLAWFFFITYYNYYYHHNYYHRVRTVCLRRRGIGLLLWKTKKQNKNGKTTFERPPFLIPAGHSTIQYTYYVFMHDADKFVITNNGILNNLYDLRELFTCAHYAANGGIIYFLFSAAVSE